VGSGKSYTIARANTPRKSKLDPYKELIQRWLERHSYTATQILQRLRVEEGYSGGITIVTDYVRSIRRVRAPAFLTLSFAPGECAHRSNTQARGLKARFVGGLEELKIM
jgi:hypothetical protein